MNKSAVTRRPASNDVDAFINKGLQQPVEASTSDDKIKHVSLRLSASKVSEIDELIKKRRVKISRHLWLLEAIEEKLLREQGNDVNSTSL